MPKVETITIFLASPGDVQAERKQAREVIEELNMTVGKEKEIRFEVVGWETDAFPSFGSDAQNIINNQIAHMERYDLFVGIMWNRFGQPTPRAGSGTEEEFDRAVDAFQQKGKPEIMFYFSQSSSNLSSLQELEQKRKVLEFKQKVQKGGLTWNYNTIDEFRIVFQRHLSTWLTQRAVSAPEPPVSQLNTSSTSTPSIKTSATKVQEQVTDSGMWVLLGEMFYEAEEVEEKNDKSIVIGLIPKYATDDAALKALQNGSQNRNEFVPYAHQNSAGIVRIISAERRSTAGKTIWSITLRFVENSNNSFITEFGINNISADEIARLRARLFLLNEVPQATAMISNIYGNNTSENFLQSIVSGSDTRAKASNGIFPELWQQFKGQTEYFLPLARLWAVYHLITSRTCEHIVELNIGPLQGNALHIQFRGRRHKKYANQEPFLIEVEGNCDLTGKISLG